MSRFFRQVRDSDSDTSSSESDESMTSGDESAPEQKTAQPGKPRGMDRFLRTAGGSSDSSDTESDDGIIDESDPESGQESDEEEEKGQRILSAQEKKVLEMEATGKAMDNALRINDWVAISNEFDKLLRMIQQQHNVARPVPPFYIKTLLNLETSVSECIAKEKEKDAKKKMSATNAKALTAMKQKVKKATKEWEVQIKDYQSDPASFEAKYAAATAPIEPTVRAAPVPRHETAEDGEGFTDVTSGKKITYSPETVFKNLQAIQEARGKKNTDRAEQIRVLEKLLEVVATPYQRIRVLLALISSRFDYNASIASSMPSDLWLAAQKEVTSLLNIVATDSKYSIQETTEDYDDMAERKPETEKDGVVRIRGSIISFVDRLDDEFTKSLQNIDPHGPEYVERLKDEKVLYTTICRAMSFFEGKKLEDPLTRVILRRIEHIYSKPDTVTEVLEAAVDESNLKPSLTLSTVDGSVTRLVHELCARLYKSTNSLLRTRAMLSHVYHHALHNDYHTARDMLLMSHLQESIHSADVATQILFNRTIVQLGLCAFRSGLVKEAQATLLDIFTTQRVKELLAQGVHQQRYNQTLTPEQEKAEKQRQLPFHMHINTEMLEAAFLVASMLVEIPLLASIESEEQKRKVISKPFRRLLDFADRQVFTGPPESTRDHIMQASRALQEGDWRQCQELVGSIKVWSLMPDSEKVKETIGKRIQEQGLRTYLFTYAPHYATLSLSMLSTTFALPLRTVTSIVSKMIYHEELSASMDQAQGVIVFHRLELSRVQVLAQSLAEKVGALVETNEKALDFKLGGAGVSGGTWGGGERGKGDERATGQANPERRNRAAGGGARRGGGGGGQRGRFAQGLGNRMPAGQRAS
ncbi:eukaryotic translation initiation factor 3 subunit 8 N-terminus-domain-containing protein [Flagelloscypha sp. PMI_526]|nr:eukaryotic translation initiation factor 3 subunit 8 N-terminus-domain-containing protein [Flagelloscypha sp. PMI_526]